eukprot:m51a1_g647 putative dephospho-CoA kinase (209) ;mRNA; f:186058-186848
MSRVIGVTGGICCGKSTICAGLRSAGAAIIDSDSLGHLCYARGSAACAAIADAFGAQRVLRPDGEIDRAALGKIVFSDPAAMQKLKSITWPAIEGMVLERVDKIRKDDEAAGTKRIVFIEAALLVDAGWHERDYMDAVWVAYTPRAEAKARLMQRNSLSSEDAEKRLLAQCPAEDLVKIADRVFNTDRPVEVVRKEVLAAYAEELKLL